MKFLSTLLTLLLAQTLCSAASFIGLSGISTPYGVSGNGAVVVGETYPSAIRWSAATGSSDIGIVPSPGYGGNYTTSADGVSFDGSVVVGSSITYGPFSSRSQAFVWTAASGIQALGDTSYRESSAEEVSSDGRVIVGSIILSGPLSGQYATVWTDGVETLRLERGTSAWGVSANGLWVVGIDALAPNLDAFLWSALTGFERIGSLGPGSNVGKDASDDGTVVVGQGGNYTPFRWTRAMGIESLGLLETGDSGYAEAISADGSIVVGSFANAGAFIWTPTGNLRHLQNVLTTDYGLDLSGWSLRGATDISPDGTTIVGYGIHNGSYQGFVATIPEPNTIALLLAGFLGTVFKRRRW